MVVRVPDGLGHLLHHTFGRNDSSRFYRQTVCVLMRDAERKKQARSNEGKKEEASKG